MKLRGAAADAAFRLLPPKTQRTVRMAAELLKVPLRQCVRALVHDYKGDVAAFRTDVIYDLVKAARKNPPKHWPNKLSVEMSYAEIAERVVGDGLISESRDFPRYLQDVHFVITGEEKVL